MKAVIMAGGLGQRLRPLTKVIPKPLLPLGEKSILDILIASLAKAGVRDVILATNYKSELFIEYFDGWTQAPVNVIVSKEETPLSTAGHLSLLHEHLTEPFFVLNGDILTNLNFRKVYDEHVASGADITIVTKEIETPLAYGVVKAEGNRVFDIHEKPNIVSEILAGIYVMSPRVLVKIPYNQKKLMTDVIREAAKDGFVVNKHLLKDYWLDIGQMENYKKAIGDISQGTFK
jgi:NDP-mannose synthase